MIKIITSQQNQEIKDVLKLKKASKRNKENLFLVDGQREVEIAIQSGLFLEKMFISPELINKDRIIKKINEEKIIQVSVDIFNKISYKENPDGYIGVFRIKNINLDQIVLNEHSIILVLDNIEKPGNLGAIIRTAYAAGISAIILNNKQTDIYNQNVIRASEGLVFLLPIIIKSQEETLEFLNNNNILTIATTIEQETKAYYNCSFSKKFALILGSEAKGLSNFWLENSKKRITIPMINNMDSLNVSVAVGIIIFEALRQRKL